MESDALFKLAELMGVDNKKIEEMRHNFGHRGGENALHRRIDLTKGTIEERHKNLLMAMNEARFDFVNSDIVECDATLINIDMQELIWKNINAYSYDVENFFLNKFTFLLKNNGELYYKYYFSIEDGSIFLLVENHEGIITFGGTIAIRDGLFLPYGAIDDTFYPHYLREHLKEGLKDDKQLVCDRVLMQALLYLIIVNQMVTKDREIITETSKRIEVPTKKKPSKKKKGHRKTIQVRYIKVDEVKIKKVRADYEKQKRESYERHVDQWSRIGYWRTSKNGVKSWIEPTTCHANGKVGEKVQKIYKLK